MLFAPRMKSVRNTRSQSQLVEFKGTGMQVVSAHLRTGNAEQLAEALETMLGSSPDFFCGEAALLDCTSTDSETVIEWSALCQLLRRYQLNPVAARVSSPAQKEAARAAGLVVVEGEERAPRSTPKPQPESKSVPPQSAPAPAPQLTSGTLLVDRPLRSGQQIYARGGDLIILAMVNTGAEVMADGNIHIYAPLRGRALAGANGNTDARIFTTCMEAELVSIAGVYRVLENGLPPEVARRSAQVKLQINEQTQQSNLTIETLSIG